DAERIQRRRKTDAEEEISAAPGPETRTGASEPATRPGDANDLGTDENQDRVVEHANHDAGEVSVWFKWRGRSGRNHGSGVETFAGVSRQSRVSKIAGAQRWQT